jgi:hypothetical protein
MMEYFFNQRTRVFRSLDDRKRLLLRSIYDHDSYAAVLPAPSGSAPPAAALRRHQRFSIRCPARLWVQGYGTRLAYPMQVIEMSMLGFQAECSSPLPEGTQGQLEIELGDSSTSAVEATTVRRVESGGSVFYGFSIAVPDAAWRRCVAALDAGRTQADLVQAVPVRRPSQPELALPELA